MKNKKGFTLIELLAVIVVLAIILVIAGTSVINSINDSKGKAKFIAAEEIANMAEAYFAVNTDKTYVSVKTLVDEGYLESDVTNPLTGKNISNSSEVSGQYIINRGIKDYENKDGEYITESISYLYSGDKLETLKEKIENNQNTSISITDEGNILENTKIEIAELKNYNNKTINHLESPASGWHENDIAASYEGNYVICYFEIPNLKYYSTIKINYRAYKNHDNIDSKIIFNTIKNMDDTIDTSNAIKIKESSFNSPDFDEESLEIITKTVKINKGDNYFVIRLDRGINIGTVPVGYTAMVKIDSIELIL